MTHGYHSMQEIIRYVPHHLSSCQGGFMTNMDERAANTVTWGIFPGKEIVQPTIIEEVSFRAWKVILFTTI
jgi:methylenetetrahydrofolate reductase (NADPH)